MNYNKAYECIEKWNLLGSVPGLESIIELCKRLDNPQNELKFIHIAGTNGKGSILNYISTVLQSAGLKTGRYISPTIRTYLERFQINGRSMSKKRFADYIEQVKEACDSMTADGLPHPTSFEIETAIAFMYFKDMGCDIVVLECGMGGRLDATNLITTGIMEVFAHIDMDHTGFLGDTIEKIAEEKSGIIKPGTVVVSMPQKKEVSDILKRAALLNDCKYYELSPQNIKDICCRIDGKYITGRPVRKTTVNGKSAFDCLTTGQSFTLNEELYSGSHILPGGSFVTPLLGTHQIDNAATSIRALQILGLVADTDSEGRLPVALRGKITTDSINKGLGKVNWPARLTIVNKKPLFVIDGAHNPDAARRLRESVDICFAEKKKIYIMGMFRDKAVKEVVDIMCGDADMVLTIATPGNLRAMSSYELAVLVREVNENVTSLDSVEEAVEMAQMFADGNSLILAFGSLSYLGRILDIFDKKL